jgi:putative ABC transport system permease protein
MRKLWAWLLRLFGLFRKERSERELAAEMQCHLQLHIEENLHVGMTPQQARREALMKLGGLEQTKELYRERRGLPLLETLLQDLRYGLRTLRRNTGFTSVAILTLALGIGANTAIFSVVDAVLLRSLPFRGPERLVLVWNRGAEAAGGDRTPLAVSDVLDWRAQSRSFDEIGAFQSRSFNYVGGSSPEWIQAASVTANFFSLLGVQPELGRNLLPDDEHPGAHPVALLSDGFWRSRFASDPNVVGRSISLDGDSYVVIGVAPPHIDFPSKDAALWAVLQFKSPTRRGPYFLTGIARLKNGVSLQAARAEVNTIKTSFPSGQHMINGQQFNFNVLPINEFIVGDVRLALLALMAAVTLVLFIAAVNVANLMLVRSATRIKEMSLRAALGASRSRIIRQLLTESILLALASGVIGVLLAAAGARLLLKLAPDTIPNVSQIGIDGRVLAWTALVSLLTGVFFGLAPAWHSARLSLDEALKEGGRATTESTAKRRWRSLLVVTELGLAVMLLISAGLLIKSFRRLQRVDSGVSTERILTMQLQLRGPRYAKPLQLDMFYPRLLERIAALPGVRTATVSNSLPPDTTEYSDDFTIEGRPIDAALPPPIAYMIFVSPDYFRTFGIPLRRGRLFTASDSPGSQRVAIISETTARQFFPHEDPLGKRFNEKGEIVGIVADVKYTGLADPIQPAIYEPLSQAHSWDVLLSVKADVADPLSLSSAVRAELHSLDPELPLSKVDTLDYRFATAVAQPRFRTTLIALFAALALLLAVIGTYGVISYSVTQRTHEIGIRMALGAQAGSVLKLVLKQGAVLAIAGVLFGLCGSFALTGMLRNLLFHVSATDWPTFGGVAVLLAGTALLACYVPARRATRIDPTVALRYE